MKKILIINPCLDGRGSGKIGAVLENELFSHFDTVTLYCFNDDGVVPIKGKKHCIGKIGNKSFPGRGYIVLFPHLFNTIKYIRKYKPDIVISIGTYCNFLGLVAQKILKFKLILSQHESITGMLKFYASTLDRLEIHCIKKLIGNHKIICVSNEISKDTSYQYNIPIEQCPVIYNGLNIDKIKKKARDPINLSDKYIIHIGGLDKNKNQELLIKAYNKTKCKNEYKLVLVGDGPLKGYLENLVRNLNLEEKVVFLGFQKNPYKYLRHASLFCFTSLSEALPTVLIESLILRIPILTVPVTGTKEILNNGECGYITDNWDIDNYTRKIDEAIDNDNSDIIENGTNFSNKKFSLEKMTLSYQNMIEGIL